MAGLDIDFVCLRSVHVLDSTFSEYSVISILQHHVKQLLLLFLVLLNITFVLISPTRKTLISCFLICLSRECHLCFGFIGLRRGPWRSHSSAFPSCNPSQGGTRKPLALTGPSIWIVRICPTRLVSHKTRQNYTRLRHGLLMFISMNNFFFF